MTIKTKVDGKCVQEYLKARIVVNTVILCVGLFYSVAYSVFASIKGTWNEARSIIPVVLGIMIVVMSSTFLIRVKKIIKMANEHPFEAVYNLEDDVILRTTFVNDEKVSENKTNYSDLTCYKVSEHYIFLVLYSKNYFPLDRSSELEEFLISKNITRK